jgi:hypothetical protein
MQMNGTIFRLCIYSLLWGVPGYTGTEIIPTLPDMDNASEGKEENREAPIKIGASFLLNDTGILSFIRTNFLASALSLMSCSCSHSFFSRG